MQKGYRKKVVSKVLRKLVSVLWRTSQSARRMAETLNDKEFRLAFEPQADDVFVVTYPRSGTTLMQQLLYQLKTEGSMEFAHISEVVPFLDRLSINRFGRLKALPQPRIFKSHYSYADIPKGPAKYIYVARDGMDVAASYYSFYRSHIGVSWSFAEFFHNFMLGHVQCGSWFEHVAGWWCRKDDPNVLFLCYEDLVSKTSQVLDSIANFCEISLVPEHRDRILQRCSFSFMKAHETKFDHLTEVEWERGVVRGAFIREGKIGSHESLFGEAQRAAFQSELAKWQMPKYLAPAYSGRSLAR